MKKFTSLMLLLLCAVTAWAQTTPTAGNWYHIKNVNAGFYMQSAIYNQNADGALQMGALSNSDAQKFYLEDAGNGKFYLKQTVALTDYYVLCNTMWNFTVTSGGDKTTYTINLVDNETDIYSIARDNGGCIGADATSNGASLYGDKGVGNNGKWQFEECDAPFVPTVCDFDPNKDYRIKSMSTGLYLQCDHPYWTGGEGAFIITDKNASDRQVFKFEKGAGENEYNITFTTDETKFYMNASGWNFYAGAEAAGNFTIALVDERGIYTIEQSYSSFKGFAGTNNGATAAGSKMYSNQGAGADNIRWTFEEVAADVFYDVVYNFSYNDSIFATASSQVLEGSAYPELEAPFGFTYEKPLGIVAHNDTVTVTCTAALPFEFAADTNSITKWYYLKLKGKYIQYLADDNTFIEWADDAVAEGEERSHLWAFVGDPINGFKLINNEAGKDMVVNNDRVLAANDSVSVWFAHKSTENTAGAFSLYNATQGQYMNAHYEGRVDYWSNDAGCMFLAEAAPDVTITYNLVYGADSVSLGTSEQAVCLGCDYPAVETPYGFAAAAPEGIALKDTTIVIACEDNLPFKYAASVEEIKNWYYVHYHSNKKDGGFINSSEGTVIWGETNNVDPENETAYMWGFVGDPINGFKVYNYATKTALTDGDEVVLGDGSVYTVKPTNETTEAAANGFTLWSNEKSTYVNAQGTVLKYWGSADAGSTVVLTEVGYTINYSYIYNETEVGTYSATATAGSEYPEVTNLPYGFTASKPEGIVEKDTTIVITCGENLPFEYASSPESITKWYHIIMHRDAYRYINFVQDSAYVEFGNTTIGENKDAYVWAFVGDILNGFKLVNRAAGTTMALSGSGVVDEDNAFVAFDEAATYAIKGSSAYSDGFTMQHTSGNYLNSNEVTGKLSYWQDNGQGSTMFLRDVKHTVNYSYVYNETEVGTNSEEVIEGSTYPSFTNLPYGFTAAQPEGVVSNDTTVVITCEENLPFEYAADGDSIVINKWYYLKLKGRYLEYLADSTYIEAIDTEVVKGEEETHLWAFVGDILNGFKLVNKAAGIDYAIVGDGSESAQLGAYADAALWMTEANKSNADAFSLKFKGSNNYMNMQQDKIMYWWDNDGGSAIVLDEKKYTVEYIYSYNNTEVGRYTTTANENTEFPILQNVPFGFSSYRPEGIVSQDTIVTIHCGEALPFEYASSPDSITMWYDIKMHSGLNRFINSVEDNSHVAFGSSNIESDNRDAYRWAFVGDILNGFKLVNKAVGTDKALAGAGEAGDENTFVAFDEAVAYTVKASSYNTDVDGIFTLQHPNGNYLNSNDATSKLSYWSSNDAGSTMKAVKTNVVVGYECNYNTIHNLAANVFYGYYYGDEYPEISGLPWGYKATKPEGVITNDTIIKINLETDLPFEFAASIDEVKNWYLVQYHSNNKKYIKPTETGISWEDAEYDVENKGDYAWAFVGDPINGFKVYNYATKTALTNGDNVVMGDGTAYIAKPTSETTTAAANGFTLWSNEKNTYVNAQGTILKYWGSADAGSTLVLTEIAMTSQRELELLIASIEAENIASSNFVGEATAASGAALAEAIATAKAITEATAEDVQALQAARDAIEYNELGEGTYMFINAKTEFEGNKAMSTYALDSWTGSHVYPAWTTINENDPLQYFTLEAADEENHYYIKTMTNEYISSATSLGDATAAEFISINGVQFKIDLGGILHANLHQYGLESSTLTTWNENANSPSAWKLMKVAAPSFSYTLNVSAAGYATLNLAFTANIPTDVTCYVAASKNDTEVKMTAIEGNVLPANTPVIVKANEGSYVFNSTTDNAPAIEDNLLLGTAYPKNYTDASYTYYVLAMVDGNVGLYPDAFEGDLFANGANKAYLKVEASQAATGFSFYFGGTTEVEDIKIAGENDTIYDVTGRKIDAITTPGLYIINGVKTIVK